MAKARDTSTSGAATIFDVAAEAGVSYSTVSRVVNDHPYIKPETRQRVEAAMQKLGYVANLRARSLAGGTSNIVGLLVYDLESSYITQVVRGVDAEVSGLEYDTMLCTTHQRVGREATYVAQLSVGVVDGLIILLPADLEEYIDQLRGQDFPYVLIDYDGDPQSNVIKVTNRRGAREATDHLIELGHGRIGFITGAMVTASARERLAGYQEAIAAAGIALDEGLVVPGDFLEETGYDATKRLLALPDPPTAIFASSDTSAFGVMRALEEEGLSVPDDVALIGFDDIPEASYVNPGLTTVRQPMIDMGRMAARLLIDTIDDRDRPPVVKELPTELVVRASTAPPR
jgi:LacI family transcriptional regulator